MATIIEILNNNAGIFCNKPILHYKNIIVPYSEILDFSDKFAQALRNLNFQPNDNIALLLPNIPEVFTAYFGCLKARCRVIPLSIQQRTYDLRNIIEQSNVKGIIFWDKFERKLENVLKQVSIHPALIQVGNRAAIDSHYFSDVLEASESISISEYPEDEHEAVILYSSGTTANPKGAILTHANIRESAQAIISRFEFTSNDKIVGILPVNHYLSQTLILNAALLCGAEILLHPQFKSVEICKYIQRNKATVFVGIPSMYREILDLPDLSPEVFSTLRFGIVSGSPVDSVLVNGYREKFGLPIIQSYGCIETTSIIISTGRNEKYSNDEIGKPFPGVEVKITDEDGSELLYGGIGEIAVKSPTNMKGYFNGSQSEDINDDSFSAGGGSTSGRPPETEQLQAEWVYPGDLCKWDENGNIELIGHKEELIDKGHFPVYPKEIESCLESHPAVKEAAVIGVYDAEHIKEIKAFLILHQDESVTIDEIAAFCSEKLPKYKRPKYIQFVDTLPKNLSGSVIKRFLK
ncbi:hypothetical protein AMJ80_02265 [bacterium SM23_31]|nr:MAG: hypothetical protein AMJ80_02265 [bacterium SM23_31]